VHEGAHPSLTHQDPRAPHEAARSGHKEDSIHTALADCARAERTEEPLPGEQSLRFPMVEGSIGASRAFLMKTHRPSATAGAVTLLSPITVMGMPYEARPSIPRAHELGLGRPTGGMAALAVRTRL